MKSMKFIILTSSNLMFKFFSFLILFLLLNCKITYAYSPVYNINIPKDKISITDDFNGEYITISGFVQDTSDVVAVVYGPKYSYEIKKKGQKSGLWINTNKLLLQNTYSFNKVFSNRKFKQVVDARIIEVLHLYNSFNFCDGNLFCIADNDVGEDIYIKFLEYMQKKELYSTELEKVEFIGGKFFRLQVYYPKNAYEGHYTTDIYIFDQKGDLAYKQGFAIEVEKIDFYAKIVRFARQQPVLYSLVAIAIALCCGAVSSLIFRVKIK
jgi:uncharacterized protein (TIGR02186 family)